LFVCVKTIMVSGRRHQFSARFFYKLITIHPTIKVEYKTRNSYPICNNSPFQFKRTDKRRMGNSTG
ncbi:hypothetical protein, partial [Elizabethkingia anophelis]|uniref:hypothetical protein n=1 Tax=Elizabethkingia anophelis TaxID=1117645 RepID=UPI00301D650A